MTRFTGDWTEAEVRDFLESVTVPIRLATRRSDGSLWLVALWFEYREDSFFCATWADAHVVRYLEDDAEVAFDVSTNEPPYRGVRGNGTTSLRTDTERGILRELTERYLDDVDSPFGQWLLSDEREEVRIRVQPRTIYSWDYAERVRRDDDSQ